MRAGEGAFLKEDFSKRLEIIEEANLNIEKNKDDLTAVYQSKLKERIKKITKGMVEIEPGRLAQEAAFIADRSDIAEEIVRAESHLKQFVNILDSDEPVGRKLNFLLQELHREYNTMGVKVGNAEIAQTIVDIKTELEKIREQVQNIE
jgi:uncharacterized protein (TIGR00255 family)